MKNVAKVLPTLLLCLLTMTNSFAQSREQVTLSNNVIAGGGAKSGTEATRSVDGTVGQFAPGPSTNQGTYRLDGGFWFSDTQQPAVAKASIGGRIVDARGRGMFRVYISLIDVSTGEIKRTYTSAFGYFRFDQLDTARVYLIEPGSKRYSFSPLTAKVTLLDNILDLSFSGVSY